MSGGGKFTGTTDVVVLELVSEDEAVDEARPHTAIHKGSQRRFAFCDELQNVRIEFCFAIVVRTVDPDEFIVAIRNGNIGLAPKWTIVNLV